MIRSHHVGKQTTRLFYPAACETALSLHPLEAWGRNASCRCRFTHICVSLCIKHAHVQRERPDLNMAERLNMWPAWSFDNVAVSHDRPPSRWRQMEAILSRYDPCVIAQKFSKLRFHSTAALIKTARDCFVSLSALITLLPVGDIFSGHAGIFTRCFECKCDQRLWNDLSAFICRTSHRRNERLL